MNLGNVNFGEYEDAWNDEEEGDVTDGEYQANIDRVEWRTSKAGCPYLNYGLKLQDGRMVWKMTSLKTAKTRGMLKRELKIITDQSCPSPSAIELNDLIDKRVQIAVQTKGDNQNVYIRSLVEDTPF